MDLKRKENIQNITQRILLLERAIETDQAMLENLKEQGATSFVLAQIEKITNRNDNRKEEICILTKKRKDFKCGLLDEEIGKEIQETNKKNASIEKLLVMKKNRLREKKQVDSDKSKSFYQKSVSADRENRFKEKDMQRAYLNYLKWVDTIPDYIQNSLKEMPNNKGYIWRGIECYGSNQDNNQSSSTVLFEKHRGLLVIHDRTPTEHKIFHKKGKDKKVLYSSIKNLRLIPTGFEDE